MKNILIIGSIALIVLVGIYWFLGREDMQGNDLAIDLETATEVNDSSAQNTDGTGNNAAGTNTVVLAENETGNFANIASANFTQPGFVAIYKVNSQGETTLLGSTDLLEVGTHANISVQLDSIVAEGETIVAVMHQDDGDGEFEFPESDFYLGNSTSAIVSDVDVVDTDFTEEAAELKEQVETMLEASAETSAEVQ